MIDLTKRVSRIKIEYESGMEVVYKGDDLETVVGSIATTMMISARIAAMREAAARQQAAPAAPEPEPPLVTGEVPSTLFDAIRSIRGDGSN